MLKHCAANRERWLSALPNVGPYVCDVKISGFTRNSVYIYIYIYTIRRLRVKNIELLAQNFRIVYMLKRVLETGKV
jgi:hypothetical protein